MKLAKTSNPKLRDTAKFRVNPDEAIRDYRLEKDVKASRQALTPNLWLNIRSIGNTRIKFRKDFYFASSGILTKFLGTFPQVSCRDALNLADEYLEANLTANISKILSPSYSTNISNASEWVGSLQLFSKNGKFTNLASKTITSIAVKEIRKIADSIFSSRKYSALRDFCELVHHIWYLARVQDYLNRDIFGGIKLIDGYILPESGGYGHIKGVADLKILINYVQNYPNTKSVRNALFLAYVWFLQVS